MKLIYPSSFGIVKSFFNPLDNLSTHHLCLSVSLWMSHGCEMLAYSIKITKHREAFRRKLCPIVGY